jgi:hypothetical protein
LHLIHYIHHIQVFKYLKIGATYINTTGNFIPTAALTTEDSDLIERFYKRNITISIKLFMSNELHLNRDTRNVVGEIKGSKFPNEIIVVGYILIILRRSSR